MNLSVLGICPITITRGTEVCLITIKIDAPTLISNPTCDPNTKVTIHVIAYLILLTKNNKVNEKSNEDHYRRNKSRHYKIQINKINKIG